MPTKLQPHHCKPEHVEKFMEWIRTRGGIAVWNSINLSNPGKSWSTPVNNEDGTPMPKPTWESDNEPSRIITDPKEILVEIPRELKRFGVAIRRGAQGFVYKCTDASSAKIRRECAKAAEKHGDSWYEFDYNTQEAVIYIPASAPVDLATYMQTKNSSKNT